MPIRLDPITDGEIEARRDELIDLLPRALSIDDDGHLVEISPGGARRRL
jgi:hypothetical protein